MNLKNNIKLRFRKDESLHELKSRYEEFGYYNEVLDKDEYLLAYDQKKIVAIVRISLEFKVAVLRGMYIQKEYQRIGIGRAMLELLIPLLDEKYSKCYCIPFAHLISFYQSINFKLCKVEDAPQFLKERIQAYSDKGMNNILMIREVF